MNNRKENKIMTTINHEYYVSLEVAKLLKEAGFDWECKCVYNKGKLCAWYEPKSNDWWKCQSDTYAAPTLEVAQRWLREVKGIAVNVTSNVIIDVGYKWCLRLVDMKQMDVWYENLYEFYEEAQEVGIKKALELILEKGE